MTHEELKKAHAAYMREWYQNNPGKNAEYCRRYRQKKKEEENKKKERKAEESCLEE